MYFWPLNEIWDYWLNRCTAEIVKVLGFPWLGVIGEKLVVSRREKMTTKRVFIEMIHIRVARETFYIWILWRTNDQFLASWGGISQLLLLYLQNTIFDLELSKGIIWLHIPTFPNSLPGICHRLCSYYIPLLLKLTFQSIFSSSSLAALHIYNTFLTKVLKCIIAINKIKVRFSRAWRALAMTLPPGFQWNLRICLSLLYLWIFVFNTPHKDVKRLNVVIPILRKGKLRSNCS